MQHEAGLNGYEVQLAVQEPILGASGNMAYADWSVAEDQIMQMDDGCRHVSEIIKQGYACKPYLDCDSEDPPESLNTYAKVIARGNAAIIQVYEQRYRIPIEERQIHWFDSDKQLKMSLHTIIVNKYVFANNGIASDLVVAIKEVDPELASILDTKVYDKDRGLRMVYCSKFEKKESILKPRVVPDDWCWKDSCITHIPTNSTLINVPLTIPKIVTVLGNTRRPSRSHIVRDTIQPDSIVQRMLLLIKRKVHPSAYYQPSGSEDAFDPARGVKFNYTDRTEPCYTGHIHSGCNNMRAFVDDGENIWISCFSERCQGRPQRIGELQADDRDGYLSQAVRVNDEFLTAERGPLKTMVQRWLARKFKALKLKSITGSGKTSLVQYLLSLPELVDATVLYVVYRQTLAFNITESFKNFGFQNYLKVKPSDRLADRAMCPRPVCQVDSINKTSASDLIVPKFKLIVLDEDTSLWNHMSATTLGSPVFTVNKLGGMLKLADYVLCLDALSGAETHEVLDSMGISQALVVNEYRGAPRHFIFSHDEESFMLKIEDSIRRSRNIYIASMSAESLYTIRDRMQKKFQGLDVLLHTSKSDDSLKEELAEVNELWTGPFTGASPSVEAGVDYTRVHMHDMYVVTCLRSTTPMGLFQMTWRVRKLANPHVHCLAQTSIRLGPGGQRKITVQECLDNLRFLNKKAANMGECETVELPSGDAMLIPKTTPMLVLTAHNEARRLNAQSRFFMEFQDIAESQGHKVTYVKPESMPVKDSASTRGNVKRDKLVNLPLVEYHDFCDIERRVKGSVASEDDKWKYYKYLYMYGWGIDSIDEPFVKKMGTDVSCPYVKACMRYIYDKPQLKDFEDINQQRFFVQQQLIKEILESLGFDHPFDVDRQVQVASVKPALMQTAMYKDFGRHIKLFDSRAKDHAGAWTQQCLTESLCTVLKTIGCSMIRSVSALPRPIGRTV